ncbi:hypothetical protein ACFXKY_14655 [Streptomyces canus]|uniref:hypothetical protein n=1 Tax=Streptomyces canus TaxID=58343 RepID=UPI0036CC1EE0
MGMPYVSWSMEVGPVAQHGAVTTVTWGSAVRVLERPAVFGAGGVGVRDTQVPAFGAEPGDGPVGEDRPSTPGSQVIKPWVHAINPWLRAEVLLKAAVTMSVPSGPERPGDTH